MCMKEYARARGFDTQTCGFNVTLAQLHALVKRFLALVSESPAGTCLFYFSGYGACIGGDNLLLSDDGKYWDMEREYLQLVTPALNKPHLVILDCVSMPRCDARASFVMRGLPINCFVMFTVMDDDGDEDTQKEKKNDYTHTTPLTRRLTQDTTHSNARSNRWQRLCDARYPMTGM